MELKGKLRGITLDVLKKKYVVGIEIDNVPNAEEFNRLASEDIVDVSIKKHREKRSLNANGLLWKCLGEIAVALETDKWEIYLQMLKRYGKYTYICVKPNVVDAVKMQWRECEEIGKVNINGTEAVQLLCYFGSSTYDSKEFSVLLDGVISEMREMGLTLPMPDHVEKALLEWEAHYGTINSDH